MSATNFNCNLIVTYYKLLAMGIIVIERQLRKSRKGDGITLGSVLFRSGHLVLIGLQFSINVVGIDNSQFLN